jgi:hypothetical protein
MRLLLRVRCVRPFSWFAIRSRGSRLGFFDVVFVRWSEMWAPYLQHRPFGSVVDGDCMRNTAPRVFLFQYRRIKGQPYFYVLLRRCSWRVVCSPIHASLPFATPSGPFSTRSYTTHLCAITAASCRAVHHSLDI